MHRAYKSIPSSKELSLTYKGTDPHLLRNDRDFYIDKMLKNRDSDYEALFKQHQQRQWKDHYKYPLCPLLVPFLIPLK
jgi:hypothetical protein